MKMTGLSNLLMTKVKSVVNEVMIEMESRKIAVLPVT